MFKLPFHKSVASLAVFAWILALASPSSAQGLIRDSEIESLLRLYANPVFRAAGLNPGSVEVNIIGATSINAFVAGGQRVFVHTGLITELATPNEVIGVLAHETGHITGGHLSQLRKQLQNAQAASIISILLGAAAVAGGAATGSNVGSAGQGVILGGQGFAQRTLLSYQRAQEASADQAAMKYLDKTKQSAKGMLDLFNKLANQSVFSSKYTDPYLQSHPAARDRVRLLENRARKSPYFNKKDSPGLLFRHKLAQAKLHGFLEAASTVFRRYPPSNKTIPARYARAIAAYRRADLALAMREIDGLIKAYPKNPYFWELKGQALFESGKAKQAVAPLRRAVKLAPGAALIRVLLGQALMATNNPKLVKEAIGHLFKAATREGKSVTLHQQLAIGYARLGDIGRADLSSAEAALLRGDLKLAKQRAKKAKSRLRKGSPPWNRANNILVLKRPKKS